MKAPVSTYHPKNATFIPYFIFKLYAGGNHSLKRQIHVNSTDTL